MLLDIVRKGSVDRSVTIRIIDSTDGTPETGVVFNTAGIDLWYRREGGAVVSITEATLASLTAAHADGGFLHIGNGYYRLDLPDAAFASGANYADVGGTVTGMIVIGGRVRLLDVDFEDAVRGGMTALPNAAAGANNGLPLGDATGSVRVQSPFKRGAAIANFPFLMTDSTNNNPMTGLTGISAARLIDDGTFTALSAPNIVEEGNGIYHFDLTSAETNGTYITVRLSAAGADDTFVTIATEP